MKFVLLRLVLDEQLLANCIANAVTVSRLSLRNYAVFMTVCTAYRCASRLLATTCIEGQACRYQ